MNPKSGTGVKGTYYFSLFCDELEYWLNNGVKKL
jgi:hypothetical protein